MSNKKVFVAVLLIALFVSACTSPAAVTPDKSENFPVTGGEVQAEPEAAAPPEAVEEVAEAPAEINFMMPGDSVPEPFRTLEDTNSSARANENRAISGDNFNNNLYERPFTSQDMVYQPDLDIQTVDFAFDDNFFYFTIRLRGMNPDPWGLNGMYAIEVDRNLNGRGEIIIVTDAPQGTDWSTDHVQVFSDSKGDVGGPDPLIPNTGFSGSGFDLQVELQAESAAFSRLDPNDSAAIQIALHRRLIDDPDEFLWGAWADNGLRDLSRFYYNDALTLKEAGSPIIGPDYPLKELFSLDNTCKLPYGFSQSAGNVPGMCKVGVPKPVPGQPQEIVCEPPYYLINGKCQYFG